jgi:ABC-type spermidine/putrescine transport system permease subunit II
MVHSKITIHKPVISVILVVNLALMLAHVQLVLQVVYYKLAHASINVPLVTIHLIPLVNNVLPDVFHVHQMLSAKLAKMVILIAEQHVFQDVKVASTLIKAHV